MKKLQKLFIIFTLFIFPSISNAEWKMTSINNNNVIMYVDFERIRKEGNNVYFWILFDFQTSKEGYLSEINYMQTDCKESKYKILQATFYKKQMGEGMSKSIPSESQWNYPIPNSSAEETLKKVCK